MAGYTPLFSSLTTGTLCGKWPDIGLWPIVLSLCDKNGVVDVTPMYLSGVTGLPIADIVACMSRFCGPDQYSRTETAGGARLELIDAHRDWGWRVINHLKYREKARKQAYDSDRTASGADAARKAASRSVPTCPAKSREVPLSDSDSDSDSNKEQRQAMSGKPDDVVVVFDHWKATHKHPRAVLDEKRRKVIRNSLKAYSAADLCQSITGYLNSPHHMGQNENKAKYDDIELLLRDAKHIDAGIKFHMEPPRGGKTSQWE